MRYGVVSMQDAVFLFGGYCDTVRGTSRVSKYTIDKWEEVGNLQNTRYGPRTILNGDRIFVVGGEHTRP